jgi:hypothetical protein
MANRLQTSPADIACRPRPADLAAALAASLPACDASEPDTEVFTEVFGLPVDFEVNR